MRRLPEGHVPPEKGCVCGNEDLKEFSPAYLHCLECETLIARRPFDISISRVVDEARDLYGREYWYSHQREMGYPDIEIRARRDLPERCVHWLHTLLKYKSPPGKALEIGSAHGGFVALMQAAGFDATGLELSPTIAAFAARTFNIPTLTGRMEEQNLPAATFDVIALMDVLEHLPSPRSTMQHCIDLLREDGILIIQTPRYREGRSYSSMLAESDAFLNLFKDEGHLYLFSASSLERMFMDLGVAELRQEEPIFSHYDQFVVVGKSPLKERVPSLEGEGTTRSQRLVQALLDARSSYVEMHDKLSEAEADRAARLAVIENLSLKLQASEGYCATRLDITEELSMKLQASETDRTTRLGLIEDLSRQLQASEADRTARLGVIEDLSRQLQASEADRTARLTVIEQQGRSLEAIEEECARYKRTLQDLASSRSVRILRRLGVRLTVLSNSH